MIFLNVASPINWGIPGVAPINWGIPGVNSNP